MDLVSYMQHLRKLHEKRQESLSAAIHKSVEHCLPGLTGGDILFQFKENVH